MSVKTTQIRAKDFQLFVQGPFKLIERKYRHDVTWTNAGSLLIETLGSSFSEIGIKIHSYERKEVEILKFPAAKCWADVLSWPRCVK